MATKKTDDLTLIDIRAVNRNISKDYLTRKEYDAYLKSLPDSADKAQPLEIDQNAEITSREEKRLAREELLNRDSSRSKSASAKEEENE